MSVSTNFFSSARPTESGSAFASALSQSTNVFTNADPAADNHVWEGDNTSGEVYGGDYELFGDLYGQGEYGGYSHFKNRTAPPAIIHT